MKIIEINGYKVLLLKENIEEGVLPPSEIADVWVINYTNRWAIRRFLRNVIRSEDPEIFLKPIFLQQELMEFDQADKSFYNLDELCDGYIKDLDLSTKIPLIEGVKNFIQSYDFTFTTPEMSKPIQNLFCYYYTRRKEVVPIRSHKSLTGYSYLRLEAFFYDRTSAYKSVDELLYKTYQQGYLNREYINTSHLCGTCYSGFLNFREKCPKCDEHNLVVRNIIHHFRCAYVGVETDFINENQLICPKCLQELRNIGVDYDKPGKGYVCRNESCNNQFQKPLVKAQCINCGLEHEPSDLQIKKIYKYIFSEKVLHEIINKGLR